MSVPIWLVGATERVVGVSAGQLGECGGPSSGGLPAEAENRRSVRHLSSYARRILHVRS